MNKYKTLDSPTHESHLQENIQQRLKFNRRTKNILEQQGTEDLPMSENKSIVFIKLPKKQHNQINSFRSSLYESSLKRLKQQKVTFLKETMIPSINSRKTYQTFEEETIKRALKENSPKKRDNLPNLHKFVGEQTRQHFSYFQKSKDKSEYETLQEGEAAIHVIKSSVPQRKSTFQVDGSMFGYHNLKDKYLQLRQLSLSNEKKSELLDKAQYRRYDPERNLNQYQSKFKMEKIIEEHMNRYNRKDLFQTKVNGFKTTIYPHDKAQLPQQEENKERKRLLETNRHHEHVENFVRKKRRSYYPATTLNSYQNQNHNEGQQEIRNRKTNSEKLQKLIQCTPWETDADF